MSDLLKDIKNQFEVNENGFGEPQAWIGLKDTNRSIEIIHEKDGLPAEEEYYSLRLHCNEDEFDNDDFHSTIGVIDVYSTDTISDNQLLEGINYLQKVDKGVKVKQYD